MKYDLIVIGGGPGGLMAARTAAEDSLKVVLIERKRDVAKVDRACLQIFYLRWVCPDEYLEPVTVESTPDGIHKLHFLGPGFTVDFKGSFKPYLNAIWVSPSGHKVYPFKNELFGYFYDKESLLAGLLASAEKAGAEIITGTLALGAENTPDGVNVFIRGKNGTQILKAKTAIAADGNTSKVVDSFGLNEKRATFAASAKGTAYYMAGVEPQVLGHETGWISLNIPSLPGGRGGIGLFTGELKWLAGDYQAMAKIPTFAPWFEKAQVVKTMAISGAQRTPLREPIVGNVIAVGDAATPEAWIQGAIACGYQAVKAIEKQLNGQKGYPEYIKWWQRSFYSMDPGYFRRVACHRALNSICNDEEVDYIYQFFENERVVPTLELARKPEYIKKDRPELYQKVKNSLDNIPKKLEPVFATYPPESAIFKDPDACLGRWIPYSEAIL
jgi:flavin-dependent dehydrogenase